ncbi:NAD(P)-dependent dehydrogenase (short-subunit alcohol dehydrogenase family) [Halomonas fontilapidosi]|uniref:NAD(P)-dependent dehydrogenase (Short-subunit alcohol dehydrogenase family) n=1 Tax=Halomonas fontilapidosi TaxID=616675 RepID=A0A7W5DIS7_9GAMM|nr:SDR family oxidoreductase [Halomonas fontilapidosi]MBB3183391.1 NAD(P)-dependent dehydrogenase (short-subunit alcohol dehydrogenase family) [Halomonas fontilapidosi]
MNPPSVVYLTGGAQGIGLGIAEHLLARGDCVALTDIDAEALAECRERLGHPERLLAMVSDVRDERQVAESIATAVTRFGRLDGVIHNAGLADPFQGPVEALDLATWQAYLDTNLTGAMLCAKHAAPHLRESRGALVLMASTRALQSEPDTEAYAASKGGVVALTHALAISLGPEIRVNAISPGWIEVGDWQKAASRMPVEHRAVDRDQHPVGRVGQPKDVAAMAAFLLSDDAGFISGQNLVVDGGMTRRMIYAE